MIWHSLAAALPCQIQKAVTALLNSETSDQFSNVIPTREIYSEMHGDSNNAFLHCGDVLDVSGRPH